MKLSIHSIGKPTTPWQIEALSTYKKRIEHFAHIEEFTSNTPKRNRNTSTDKLMEKEYHLLAESIPESAVVILLDETGKSLTSQQFSTQFSNWRTQSQRIAFLIGGPDGHHQKTRQLAHYSLSLSSFTLPHIFARIVLYEQLYRAFTLSNNHPYHR
ncbi:MAG: 23S rRNA (pseudouridine(1915)-N(3))-methyltransferase RlmH [Pseudomonadota bacterium]|nr:23S rRNA (pseudouridine(1915)-N(3))-methyltransferase RlmH [Pseudomonadota bacterium]